MTDRNSKSRSKGLNVLGGDELRGGRSTYRARAKSSKSDLSVPLSTRQKKYSSLHQGLADSYDYYADSKTSHSRKVEKADLDAFLYENEYFDEPEYEEPEAFDDEYDYSDYEDFDEDYYEDDYEDFDDYDEDSEYSDKKRKKSSVKKTTKKAEKKGKQKTDIFAIIVLALQAILSIGFIIVLAKLNVLPAGWFIAVIAVLVILWGVVFLTQFKGRKKLPLIGKIFSILLCIILAIGNYYVIITNKAIDIVTDETVYNYTYLDVVVLKDDPAQDIKDAKDYTFGTQATYQPLNLNQTITEIENDIGSSIETKDYDTVLEQADALYSKEVPAIIYNRNFKGTIIEKHENFEEDVRIIKTVTIKEELNIKSNSNVDVTTQPFLFYISGNDEYGELTIEGRSDVNMLVAVNPNSRQVLMITTPRDYYVELPGVSNGTRDKLTHAGVYGTQCQLDTLEELYGYPIDYYCKVNFSSLIDIVDAIGGVDVYNEQEFEFDNSDGLIFEEGWLHLGGYRALCFCRERNSFADGDFARARHQQAVIEAIINKLLSTTGFSAYSQLIKTLESCCVTNMPKDSISALVKKQLAEGGSWTISKASAEGEGYSQTTWSMGDMALDVVIPYAQSLRNITSMLDQLYNGEAVTVLQLGDNDDYSLIVQPGPVPEQPERDEDGNTIKRIKLVDGNGVEFGERIQHIDPDTEKVVREELVDSDGNPLSEEEVEERMNADITEDNPDIDNPDDDGDTDDPDADDSGDGDEGDEGGEGGDEAGNDEGGDEGDEGGEETDE
ncbi:MAG: LCP family protein [Lachnospiraceae bacterium]|nr:LCP family protein [Lachnospiraceae bacterium]